MYTHCSWGSTLFLGLDDVLGTPRSSHDARTIVHTLFFVVDTLVNDDARTIVHTLVFVVDAVVTMRARFSLYTRSSWGSTLFLGLDAPVMMLAQLYTRCSWGSTLFLGLDALVTMLAHYYTLCSLWSMA